MKSKLTRVIIALVITGACAAALSVWLVRNQVAPGGQLVLSGNVDIRQVQLAFNGNERISSMLVQEGDRVKAGQLLATLETQRLEAGVAAKRAQVRAQHEVVSRLEAGNRPEEIRKAKADWEAAKADLHNAELTYNRVILLATQGVDTQQRRDDAQAILDVAKSRSAATKEAYDLMVLGPRKEDIAAAQATLEALEGDLALALRELADSKLYAPTNGPIQNRLLEPGDMASPQKPVFTLAMDDPLWVRAYVPEPELGKIRLGMKAIVTTDSYPGKHYEGWVGFISPAAEFTPKTVESSEVRTKLVYQVRVFVRNPEHELRLGMPAVATIELNQPPQPTSPSPTGDGP